MRKCPQGCHQSTRAEKVRRRVHCSRAGEEEWELAPLRAARRAQHVLLRETARPIARTSLALFSQFTDSAYLIYLDAGRVGTF